MNKKYFKLAVAIFAALYFFYYVSSSADWHFIDNVNLLIHEAGHWIFWPLGEFMHVLGGSLNQVLVPLLFVIYFYIQKQFYSSALVLFWVAQNLINVSVYAGDALRMQLPLLGGDEVIHDWNWLLLYTGQLRHTAAIAQTIEIFGILLGITAAIWAIKSSFNEHD